RWQTAQSGGVTWRWRLISQAWSLDFFMAGLFPEKPLPVKKYRHAENPRANLERHGLVYRRLAGLRNVTIPARQLNVTA
nr:hypothetical protein [Candidatus Cloacimonadota bacterium]